MHWTDLTKSSPAERAAVFGEIFRNVQMVSYSISDTGVQKTVIVIDGRETTLVGDPEKALRVYRNGIDPKARRFMRWLRRLFG